VAAALVAAVATGLRYVLAKPRDQLDRLDPRQRPTEGARRAGTS